MAGFVLGKEREPGGEGEGLAQDGITSREGAGRLFGLSTSLSSRRATPDLAIWAHQAGQISSRALEATVEALSIQRALATFPIVRFTATMFRAQGHIVLCSTELSGQHD